MIRVWATDEETEMLTKLIRRILSYNPSAGPRELDELILLAALEAKTDCAVEDMLRLDGEEIFK
jgi:hypothetical protein